MRTQVHQFTLGAAYIDIGENYIVTLFPDGVVTTATFDEQPGQAETAKDLGMTVREMNRTHDLTHSLLAHWLGMPYSPTLRGVAIERHYQHHDIEEAAVLAIQRWAKVAGVNLLTAAQKAYDEAYDGGI